MIRARRFNLTPAVQTAKIRVPKTFGLQSSQKRVRKKGLSTANQLRSNENILAAHSMRDAHHNLDYGRSSPGHAPSDNCSASEPNGTSLSTGSIQRCR